MTVCHRDGSEIKRKLEDWGYRGRGDLAVDVMTIVGYFLWDDRRSRYQDEGSVNAGILTT
ncbi:MAG: hypothetical protein HQ475_09750 [SAR202 cluster bacterium]|nr:hypothetical protein [SAR202 cluster bacterium]